MDVECIEASAWNVFSLEEASLPGGVFWQNERMFIVTQPEATPGESVISLEMLWPVSLLTLTF